MGQRINKYTRGDYDAIVYIDGTEVIAEDSLGRKIASGVAGTDENAVFTAASSYIDGLGGGRLVIVNGSTFAMSDKWDVGGINNIEIIGVGYPELDFSACGADVDGIYFQGSGCSNILIHGLRISNSKHCGIIGLAVNNGTISNCIVNNAQTQGINLQGTDIHIDNNHVSNIADEFGIVLGGYVNGAWVTNNYVYNCATIPGIEWGYSGKNVHISNNHVQACKYGIVFWCRDTTGCTYARSGSITNNTIDDMSQHGVWVCKRSDASAGFEMSGMDVSNNKIYNTGHYGVMIGSDETTDEPYTISLVCNEIRDATEYGIYLYNSNKLELKGNIIENITSVSASNYGILANNVEGLDIIQCTSYSPIAAGISISGGCTRVNIESCKVFDSNTHGISIYQDGVSIRDCIVDTTTLGNTIYLQSGNIYVGVRIIDNILVNSGATPYIKNVYSGNYINIKRNSGYVTENSGSSTGTGAEQTIAHGLVSTPSRVVIEIPSIGYKGSCTADATNIYPTVFNGVAFNWSAEV